ncbi:MAG TPA: right-handed parallel beta-helix repeat-containing protein [Kofleriaceae bacterium]|nr:right-handed parallel beta-helix repeat-containing protein [Kofleriaceae bacterium]
MELVHNVGEFVRDPIGRCVAGRTWIAFCSADRISGFIGCDNSGGDGLYVRQASSVTVSNSVFDGVYRNAASVTGQVNGLTITGCHFDSSMRDGFDFEPNTAADFAHEQHVVE